VFATVTVQLLAVYVVPVDPYVALTGFPLVGPKFVPVSVIDVPPAVGIEDPPATPVIAGATYDSNTEDAALACPPTVTIHFRPPPTPTAFTQVIVVLNTVTVHDVAVYSNPVDKP
jgi:hypothetical protein